MCLSLFSQSALAEMNKYIHKKRAATPESCAFQHYRIQTPKSYNRKVRLLIWSLQNAALQETQFFKDGFNSHWNPAKSCKAENNHSWLHPNCGLVSLFGQMLPSLPEVQGLPIGYSIWCSVALNTLNHQSDLNQSITAHNRESSLSGCILHAAFLRAYGDFVRHFSPAYNFSILKSKTPRVSS